MVKELADVRVCERLMIHILDNGWVKKEKLRELDLEDFGGEFVSFL